MCKRCGNNAVSAVVGGRKKRLCDLCRTPPVPACNRCGVILGYGERGWPLKVCGPCSVPAPRALLQKECVQCGKSYSVKGGKITCSAECCSARQKKIQTTLRHTHICKQCGIAFMTAWPSATYCSRNCRVDSTRSRSPTKCRWCGCSVPPKKGDNKGLYCSRQCTFKQWGFESSLKATQKGFRSRLRLLVMQKARDAKAIEVAVRKAARNSATCKTCGIVFMRKWTTCPPTTCIECRVAAKRADRKTRKVAHKQLIKEVVTHEEKRFLSLRAIHRRDCGICYICGKLTLFSVDPNHDDYPNRDHVIPLSRGGRHSLDNLRTACRACNLSKRDMTIAEFIKSR